VANSATWLPSSSVWAIADILSSSYARDGSTVTSGTRLTVAILLFFCVLECLGASAIAPAKPELALFPKHFALHPGERIHYQAVQRSGNGQPRSVDYDFAVRNSEIVRAIEPKGVIEAMKPGRTELVVRTAESERSFTIDVTGGALPAIPSVPYGAVREIAAKELLFVGHANRDGFDHTAIAKPGIDRLVRQARLNGWPLVYFVSQEYPDWYTADRHPDYAIVTEGQEHQIRVDAERVTFAGGSFMFCLLRNAQMTLHGMLDGHAARRIHFVFPAEAIWVEDIWGPGSKRPYPAPMLLLKSLFARRGSDARAYEEILVPFMDRMINQFPVAGYPAETPTPELNALLRGWSVVVRIGNRFERVYRRGDSDKILLIELEGV
jgi:hypothetical protein